MDLVEALRTTGAVREFEDRPVDRATLERILDVARFAPNGGNQQAWKVVCVEDPQRRRALRDLYVAGWLEYLAQRGAGIQPWSPLGDREAEERAVREADLPSGDEALAVAGDFAANLDRVPLLLVVLADLSRLAATDRDLGRHPIVAGASIYPFVWSVLLAARAEGLGGVLTTVAITREPQLLRVVDTPADHAVAAVLALGHPAVRPTRLRRDPVEAFLTVL